MSHNPNPFDFVPFVESGPNLYPLKEFVASDKLLTGYLTVRIKALTPVHIVGDQNADGKLSTVPHERDKKKKNYKINNSSFFRRGSNAIIPSSTIRGCLRSFIEAATNGWVSQFTPYYEQKNWTRKYGFKVDGNVKVQNQKLFDQSIPAALNVKYILPPDGSDIIDIPSFLFGYTSEEGNARKGCVVIEDAMIAKDSLGNDGRYRIPDINDSAFMGGPKPSASSWWYQYPHQIRLRKFKDRDGSLKVGADFIGSGYRGRKFYFHQDSAECYDWYSNSKKWPQRSGHEVYPIPVECLKPGSETDEFRIYFDEIHEQLLKLLILALMPGSSGTEKGKPTLRHKLGYGKAYGYGSIEYMITGGKIREEKEGSTGGEYIQRLQKEVVSSIWDFDKLNKIGIGKYLHKKNLEMLAKILWFDSSEKLLFQYPPFGNGGFLPVITEDELLSVLDDISKQRLLQVKSIAVNRVIGKNLARQIYHNGYRKALHFKVYQENSDNYQKIQQRNLYNCQ